VRPGLGGDGLGGAGTAARTELTAIAGAQATTAGGTGGGRATQSTVGKLGLDWSGPGSVCCQTFSVLQQSSSPQPAWSSVAEGQPLSGLGRQQASGAGSGAWGQARLAKAAATVAGWPSTEQKCRYNGRPVVETNRLTESNQASVWRSKDGKV
jgi:hypothetical protein